MIMKEGLNAQGVTVVKSEIVRFHCAFKNIKMAQLIVLVTPRTEEQWSIAESARIQTTT
jgi:hypothetical protein